MRVFFFALVMFSTSFFRLFYSILSGTSAAGCVSAVWVPGARILDGGGMHGPDKSVSLRGAVSSLVSTTFRVPRVCIPDMGDMRGPD